MSASQLPASTAVLGIVTKALEAARYAKGPKACALKDRTGRRCLAGSVRTRHWCCRLTALLDFLRQEKLIDLESAHVLVKSLGVFLPFAAMVVRWELAKTSAQAPPRAHARFVALNIATAIQLLSVAGARFTLDDAFIRGLFAAVPTSAARRAEPLAALRLLAKAPSRKVLARHLGCTEHTLGRWLAGARPKRERIGDLATYFAKRVGLNRDELYRALYWHYALGDVIESLRAYLSEDQLAELVAVTRDVARCRSREIADEEKVSLVMPASLLAPTPEVVAHAVRHGASPEWVTDVAAVVEDHRRAGADLTNAQEQFLAVFARLPRRRGAPRSKTSKSRSHGPRGPLH